jgi:hypothetical protein
LARIIVPADCGNSPKNLLLKKLNIAFAKGQVNVLLKAATDDIVWNILGDKKVEGKKAFAAVLKEMKRTKVERLVIQNIISHGKAGTVNGEMTLASGQTFSFCDVYQFANAKGQAIQSITSYVMAS